MRIEVDFDKCQSNAVCQDLAPQVFEVRDDGYLYVLIEEPPEAMRDQIKAAEAQCPTQAITIID